MKVAAIDIGSNSVHMIVAEAADDGFDIVDREKDVIRLGAGTFKTGRLSREAFAAGVSTMRRFGRLLKRHGVEHAVAVATSAVREAANGEEFLKLVADQTGIVPSTITGTQEARLIHLGVRTAIDLEGRTALIIDIGGGSVETIVGHDRGIMVSKSLKLGVLRLRDQLRDDEGNSRELRRRLQRIVKEQAERVLTHARRLGFDVVIGTSGTILSLGTAAFLRRGGERWKTPNGHVIRTAEIRSLADDLLSLTPSERGSVQGVDGHRADTIHIGAVLVSEMLELAGADSITLCDASIREGLIEDFLLSAGGERRPRVNLPDVRERSAFALLRRCGQADAHARHVRKLALALFDETLSLHRLTPAERRMLEYAALLHDVGRSVGFERHEHHGKYIVENGDLRGFSQREIEMMALIVRYHRKTRPRGRELPALRRREFRVLNMLSGLLRVAEGLDRGHRQAVTTVRCEQSSADALTIAVGAEDDAELEIWAAQTKSSALAKALEKAIRFELEEEVVPTERAAQPIRLAHRR